MRKRKLLFTLLALSLFLIGGSRAMAQSGGWDAIYKQTQTTSDNWTAITEGSTNGKVLGAAGTTTYYYVKTSLNFTNDRTDNDGNGNSGLKIQGTVYLYLPAGVSITCRGANADGRTGAGAGIELSSGNTLYLIGGGNGTTVTAIGGNAANGGNGGNGGNASGNYSSEKVYPGNGGNGGNGGGGAGAGIGSRGGTGGTGGAGGSLGEIAYKKEANCAEGKVGSAGGTAAAMGTLYVDQTYGITVNATSGKKGTSNGAGGAGGSHFMLDFASNQSVAGGGGGGGGGYGGAACSSGIGTGGPGGGAGNGGTSGSTRWKNNPGYYRVGAAGGGTGQDADGNWHESDQGASTLMSGTQYFNNDSFEDKGEDGGTGIPAVPAYGGVRGNAASNGTMNAGKKEYKITFGPLKTDLSKDSRLTHNADDTYSMTYSPSGATNVILPANKIGYNWVLRVYGKSCAPQGNSDNEFATPTKAYYGGNGDELTRTIVLENVYGDLYFQEVASVCRLNSSGNNDQNISEFCDAAYDVTVRLEDRTLYRDNHWNTICLPFSMDENQIAASPLAGATIMKMNETHTGYYGSGANIPSMNVHFEYPVFFFYFETVNTIEAGKPYLVKWTEASKWTKDGNYMDNTTFAASLSEIRHELDFSNVKVTAKTPGSLTGHATFDGNIIFQGTFSSSATLTAGDKTKLMLGAGDKLYYPSKNINVGACRGYFIIPEAAASAAPQFVMGFDDGGETTDIQVLNITPESQNDGAIYNLSGQRLTTLQKGVNIVNGKKVVVK